MTLFDSDLINYAKMNMKMIINKFQSCKIPSKLE